MAEPIHPGAFERGATTDFDFEVTYRGSLDQMVTMYRKAGEIGGLDTRLTATESGPVDLTVRVADDGGMTVALALSRMEKLHEEAEELGLIG